MKSKRLLAIVFVLMLSFAFGTVIKVDAAVKTTNELSGTAVKANNTIYYRIQNSLYQYDTKSKEIKQLCSIDYEISSIRKYGADIYLLTSEEIKDNKGHYVNLIYRLYKYNINTASTDKIGDYIEFLGIMDGALYCIYDQKDVNGDRRIIRIDNSGESDVQSLDEDAGSSFIWDNKLYYSKLKSNAKPDEYGEYGYKDCNFYYMTSDRTVHKVTQKKYKKIVDNNIAFASYPEKGVYNQVSSATAVKYGKKYNVYYGYFDYNQKSKNKKYFLVKALKKNKMKKLYTIKSKTKKYKKQYIFTMDGFKKQMIIVIAREYKKKQDGYIGEYVYKLVNYKGKVIKTLGKKKYK
ncbi:MAG: hypothetical protein K5656_01745 [Lachnospiraceae bacterium]|nr:hypothetical protein [Lachnospiraceae bacterium]